MTLEEKKLPWISHHLNTRKGEHISPEYFAINPNGLVPTLIHDGEVWIESADIIVYLDQIQPLPRLTPTDEKQLLRLSEWLTLASTIHVSAVKTYIYASQPGGIRRKTPAELERYRSLQSNEELLAFHAMSSSEEGISAADRASAESLLHRAFAKLDVCLGEQAWLAGDNFTLADITWAPLHYTLERAGFSFSRHENVTIWARAVAKRPGFQQAVVDWFDGPREARTASIAGPFE